MEFDNLDTLRVLLATAETGSLTGAGKRCRLTTAAVSAAIKRLETFLGVRLFERTTRSIRPTAEGEVMIDHARRALELVSQGQALARAGSEGLAGSIRISVAAVIARELLASWLADFTAVHPHVVVDMQVSDVHVDLVRDGIDLALRHGPLPDSTYSARLMAPARRVACASPDYLARHGTPAEPAELAKHSCVIHHVRRWRLDEWVFEREGCAPACVGVRGSLATNDASIAQQWSEQGRGVIYQSELALLAALESKKLMPLFPGWEGAAAPLYAVLPGKRYVPARVSELVERLGVLFTERLHAVRTLR